ncbi:MAG: nucleoid-associated protein [Verrucomicrobiota bacterium]
MSVKIRFNSAITTGLVLAKVGHPQRDEPLQTSKDICAIAEDDQETLCAIFLKPFKNLSGHRFSHHAALDQHEMHCLAAAIFADPACLLEKGCDIAKRLYAKSNHPNIKSGDLCMCLIRDIEVNGELTQGLCILKSESVVPFLSISTRDGDLLLSAEQGINPDKIDKGCLILNHQPQKGCHVLTFDRSGTESRFWVRDFLAVVPITDSPFLTNKYANMAVAFVEQEAKQQPRTDDAPPWGACSAAHDALGYFEGKEKFSLQEFEEQVLKTPEAAARFATHRAQVEKDQGHRLEDSFDISKKDVNKAKKKVSAVIKLDTGVEIHLKSSLAGKPDAVIERGFDDAKGMKFIKVFFNQDVSV